MLTITQINDFIFCPKSLYYNGIYRDNLNSSVYNQVVQEIGLAAHNSIDNNTYSTRGNIITGMMVFCEKYNLLGKIDILDISNKTLIERKYMVKNIYDGFKYQLYSQYFALTEMGYKIEYLKLFSKKDNKTYDIELPNELEIQKFEMLLSKIRNWNPNNQIVDINMNKCKNCIYNNLCDINL